MAETYFGLTDTGRQRDNNEDAFIAEPIWKNKFIAACVIDGVGGYEGGEIAAATAKTSILQYFSVPSGSIRVMMQEAIVSANEKIYIEKRAKEELGNMACVLTLALIDKEANKFYYAHVGDTRLYLFRDGSLVKITKDQSFVGFLEDAGKLTEKEAMEHPKRNIINKALGFDSPLPNPAEYIEMGESPFLPGDLLLLCSDGLTDLVDRNGITTILTNYKTLAEKAAALIEAANAAGGKDNITVVLVHNTSKGVKLKPTKPSIKVKKNPGPLRADSPDQPAEKVLPQAPVMPKKRTASNVLVPALVLFSIVCAAGFIWLLLKDKKGAETTTGPETTNERGSSEPVFADEINRLTGSRLVLNPGTLGATLYLTDTTLSARILYTSSVMALRFPVTAPSIKTLLSRSQKAFVIFYSTAWYFKIVLLLWLPKTLLHYILRTCGLADLLCSKHKAFYHLPQTFRAVSKTCS
jgi:serine/threonine protein phosphatase PrpC